jgi:hypothetical protein
MILRMFGFFPVGFGFSRLLRWSVERGAGGFDMRRGVFS